MLRIIKKSASKKLFTALLLATTTLSAGTMFTLSGIKQVYPVVEIAGKSIPKSYKELVYEELNTLSDELGIDMKGFNQRSLALIVDEKKVDTTTVVQLRLIIGEQVRRLDSDEKTFAFTYLDKESFIYKGKESVEENFEDSLDSLLSRFSDQYLLENKSVAKVKIGEEDFASAMKYETNYKQAVKRAQKEHKNIMLVLVANYCPWCRKFEQRVLLKNEVNTLVQANYIPLIINKEKEPFPQKFNKSFTPIVHFIDYKSLESYESVVGYNNRDEFLFLLKKGAKK